MPTSKPCFHLHTEINPIKINPISDYILTYMQIHIEVTLSRKLEDFKEEEEDWWEGFFCWWVFLWRFFECLGSKDGWVFWGFLSFPLLRFLLCSSFIVSGFLPCSRQLPKCFALCFKPRDSFLQKNWAKVFAEELGCFQPF